MWVLASVCPTVGSQLGQSPAKYNHFCSIQLSHSKKGRILISFMTITPILIKNTGNMVKIGTYMVLSRPFRFLSRPLHFSV